MGICCEEKLHHDHGHSRGARAKPKVKASKLSQLLERALWSNYPRQRAIFYLVKVMLYFSCYSVEGTQHLR